MKQYYITDVTDFFTKERHFPTWLVGTKPPKKTEDEVASESDTGGIVRPIFSFLVFVACFFSFYESFSTMEQQKQDQKAMTSWDPQKWHELDGKIAVWGLAAIALFFLLLCISRVTQTIVVVIVLICLGAYALGVVGNIFRNLQGKR